MNVAATDNNISAESGLKLFPVGREHLELLLAWRQDRDIMKYLPTAPLNTTWEEHYRWWINHETFHYMVYLYDSTGMRAVGVVRYDSATEEIGIIIGEKSLWGKGIGTRAIVGMMQYLGIFRCWAAIHPDNIGSQKAFSAAGFTRSGNPARNGQEEWVWWK